MTTEESVLLSKYEKLRGYPTEEFDVEDWREFDRFEEGYKLARKEIEALYTDKELFNATLESMNLGMVLREHQLSGWSDKSGNEVHKEWFDNLIIL